jgi:putative chitinase
MALANLVYAGRMGNGPVASGDGWAYRGRGLIQLTGRSNYRAAGAVLGIPLETDPDRARTPWNACLIAGWFWSMRNCNAPADQGEAGLAAITKAINGGRHGIEDRARRYERALAALAAHPETLEA